MRDLRRQRDDVLDELGSVIRAARERLYYAQQHIQEDEGWAKGFLSAIENGRQAPSADRLQRMAEILDMSAEEKARSLRLLMEYKLLAFAERYTGDITPEQMAQAALDLAKATGLTKKQLIALIETLDHR